MNEKEKSALRRARTRSEGITAYKMGKPQSANPHKKEWQRLLWIEGWTWAKEHLEVPV